MVGTIMMCKLASDAVLKTFETSRFTMALISIAALGLSFFLPRRLEQYRREAIQLQSKHSVSDEEGCLLANDKDAVVR